MFSLDSGMNKIVNIYTCTGRGIAPSGLAALNSIFCEPFSQTLSLSRCGGSHCVESVAQHSKDTAVTLKKPLKNDASFERSVFVNSEAKTYLYVYRAST